MYVFKFGGASVKDAAAVRNLKDILDKYPENIVVVISAMGKTTNSLESLLKSSFENPSETKSIYNQIQEFHLHIIDDLFGRKQNPVIEKIQLLFNQLEKIIHPIDRENFDLSYDSMVSFGELFSTLIVSEYLNLEKQ